MKTEYEKRAKYGVNAWFFGKPKAKHRPLYFVIILIILLLGFLLQ
jgi:hypothetical protein